MARPRKNPTDPKWAAPFIEIARNVSSSEQVPTESNAKVEPKTGFTRRDAFFAAAMAGLIARGGTSMENLIRTAGQYADEAEKAAGGI